MRYQTNVSLYVQHSKQCALLRSRGLYSAMFCHNSYMFFVDVSVLFCVFHMEVRMEEVMQRSNAMLFVCFCCNEGSEDSNVLWVDILTLFHCRRRRRKQLTSMMYIVRTKQEAIVECTHFIFAIYLMYICMIV